MDGLYTRTDYARLPEGFPAQLIEGLLVKEPQPRYGHQRSGSRLRFKLMTLLGPDRVPDPPCDVIIDDHNVFQPDIVVLAEPLPGEAKHVGVPVLAVEILSPSTEGRDRRVKTVRLLERGVHEVWLLDWRKQTVEVHTPGGRRLYQGDEEVRTGVVGGLHVVPSRLFAE